MSFLKTLSLQHTDVFNRVQIFEKAAIECFENKIKLSEKEYLKIVTPCRTLFKVGLIAHFKLEEITLFPILITKSKKAEILVKQLISDHLMMLYKFKEFGAIEDYNLSIKLLSGLMKDLSIHAKKEEDFFSTIQLTKDEATRIEEVAKGLGV